MSMLFRFREYHRAHVQNQSVMYGSATNRSERCAWITRTWTRRHPRARIIPKARSMQILKQLFGWFFGLLSVVCLGASIFVFRGNLIQSSGALHPSTFIVFLILGPIAFIFARAWWTTWKAKPSARAWGITASLVNLFVPLSLIYFFHRHLTDSRWRIVAVSVLALVTYAWPDRENDRADHEQFEGDDPVVQ